MLENEGRKHTSDAYHISIFNNSATLLPLSCLSYKTLRLNIAFHIWLNMPYLLYSKCIQNLSVFSEFSSTTLHNSPLCPTGPPPLPQQWRNMILPLSCLHSLTLGVNTWAQGTPELRAHDIWTHVLPLNLSGSWLPVLPHPNPLPPQGLCIHTFLSLGTMSPWHLWTVSF